MKSSLSFEIFNINKEKEKFSEQDGLAEGGTGVLGGEGGGSLSKLSLIFSVFIVRLPSQQAGNFLSLINGRV